VNGGPVPILEGVMRAPNPGTQSGVAHFATSANGVLAYVPGTVVTGVNVPKSVALVDSNGKTHVLPLRPQAYSHPRVSSDGTHFLVATDDGNESVVWVGDLKAGGPLRRLTFGGRNRYPIWSPEGRFVYFQSDRDGDLAIFRQPADGSGGAERVTKPDQGTQHEPESWSPDRKTLSMDVIRGVNQGVWTMSSDGDHTLATFMDAPNTTEKHSVFSPDVRWLAYMSTPLVAVNSSGGTDVFVQPFPATGAKYQISSGGGRTPLWSPDGRRLFYHEPATNRLVGVDVRTQPAFTVGKVAPLAVDGTIHPLTQRNYDITPDGKQFLVILPMTSGTTDSARRSAHQVDIVLNWFEELKARVPTR